jgi:ferredoxin
MKVCPNNALHPAFFEAGVEGMWTPILIPRIGYCEHSCVLCGQVCPTGAIQKITEKQKLGLGQKPISIGTAFYDQGRCLPWAMGTPCIVCEEFCPTSPKAIWVEPVEVPKRSATPGPTGRSRRWSRCAYSGRTSTRHCASAVERARRSAPCRTSPPST